MAVLALEADKVIRLPVGDSFATAAVRRSGLGKHALDRSDCWIGADGAISLPSPIWAKLLLQAVSAVGAWRDASFR